MPRRKIRDKMLGTVIIMYWILKTSWNFLRFFSESGQTTLFTLSFLALFFDLRRSAQSLILKSFKLVRHTLGTIKPNNWTIVQNWQYSLLKTFNGASLSTKRDSLFTHIEKIWLLQLSLNSKVLSTSTSLSLQLLRQMS